MDYKEAVKDIINYLKEGFERDGPSIFSNINDLREIVNEEYSNSRLDKKYPLIQDHLIGSVISEIFGEFYITGKYNFNIFDNALEQLKRRGLNKDYV